MNSTTIYSPNQKYASLIIGDYYYTGNSSTGSYQKIFTKVVIINGTNITNQSYGDTFIRWGNIVDVYHTNDIYILQVIGYR